MGYWGCMVIPREIIKTGKGAYGCCVVGLPEIRFCRFSFSGFRYVHAMVIMYAEIKHQVKALNV